MTDHPDLPFEQVLQRELAAFAGAADGPFDPRAIAHTAVAARPRPSIGPIRIRPADSRLLLVAVVALLVALLAAAAFVGSRLPLGHLSPLAIPLAEIDPCLLLHRALADPAPTTIPLWMLPHDHSTDRPQAHSTDRPGLVGVEPLDEPTPFNPRRLSPGGAAEDHLGFGRALGCTDPPDLYWWYGWGHPRLIVRVDPTTAPEAEALLGLGGAFRVTGLLNEAWHGGQGIWRAQRPDVGWSAVAVFEEPYFFVVTGPFVPDEWLTENIWRVTAEGLAAAVARDIGIGDIGLDAP